MKNYEGMKLGYVVLGSDPLRIKCFYEVGEGDDKRYGEFYINQTRRDAKDANNMTDKLGVRGELEITSKDKDYGIDLVQGFAEAMQTDLHFASFVVSGEQQAKEEAERKVTEEQFKKYVKVQKSGKTNMFDVNAVMRLSGLDRETILDCMKNYANYTEKYNSKGGE